MDVKMVKAMFVAHLKTEARKYNREQNWMMLREAIKELERLTPGDDRAMAAFYTELEQEDLRREGKV